MKVFWSWQSDTPDNVGRGFVRKALESAIEKINAEISIDESERPEQDDIELDHDRKGVPGSPDLARTILKKIQESTVFVADVTPVGRTPAQPPKHLMNPNVAIELGYAMARVGDEAILLVLNKALGDRATLPFDLSHKAGPIMYELLPDATKDDIKKAKAILVGTLKVAIKECIKGKERKPVQKPPPHDEIQSKTSRAQFFDTGAVLAARTINLRRREYFYKGVPLLYLRVIPSKKMPEIPPSDIEDLLYGIKVRPLHHGLGGGESFERNRYGGMTFSYGENHELLTSTQLFFNREIWGIDTVTLESRNYIPSGIYERVLYRALHNYLAFGEKHLGLEYPLIIEAGASRVEGMKMAMPDEYMREEYSGEIFHPEIGCRHVLKENTNEAIDAVLLDLFSDFFGAVGKKRPQNFNGFPRSADLFL